MSEAKSSRLLDVARQHLIEQVNEIDLKGLTDNDSEAIDYAKLQISHIDTLIENLPMSDSLKKSKKQFIHNLEALIEACEEYNVQENSESIKHYVKSRNDLIDELKNDNND